MMFGLKRSPLSKLGKHNSVDAGCPVSSGPNPFDSDDETPMKHTFNPSKRNSSEPVMTINSKINPFDDDDDDVKKGAYSSYSHTASARNKYKSDFHDFGGIENRSVQELEDYAVYKAEETTKSVKNCLKIAEEIREDATKTLVALHHQGEQITGTHMVAADIDHALSRGEKLLGNLGGIFSKTWKPKKNRPIMGPVLTKDDSLIKKASHIEQRERLGLNRIPRGRSSVQAPSPEPTNALQRVEVEKAKQDDGLSNLSNLLGELKDMAVDMGSEIERQNKALDYLHGDVDELNYRVKGANERGRRLLGK